MNLDFLIGGEKRRRTQTTYPVFCKADQSVIAEVPDACAADIDAAVTAARAALPVWHATPAAARAAMLHRFAGLMDAHAESIAELNGPEMGISKAASAGGIRDFHSGLVRFYAGIADKQFGRVLEHGAGPLNYTVREPIGVVGCMLAWNTPLGSFTQKVPPAIIAGNTVVVRAADEAPLSTLYLAQLVQEAGFPPGVINIVSGLGPTTGAYLVPHPGVDGISFTGSVAVGRAIAAEAAKSFKRTVLELGGKAPFIICPDADLGAAVQSAVRCAFAYQGQGCSAVARVLVPESLRDDLVERMVNLTKSYKPALPDDDQSDGPTFGPLFNRKQLEATLRFVEIAKRDGELLTGGNRIETRPFANGYYVQPAVAVLENTDSELWKEEVFGPLFTISAYRDEQHAIDLANDTRYGLSGAVWTRCPDTGRRIASQLRFGTVWVNSMLHWTYHSPWGGFKQSGWGREFGIDAVHSFTEVKSVWLNP
jgi:aldehyde dehydrogenase (NAD+)